MFDGKEYSQAQCRSGTAPSQPAKTSVYSRSRPKTRTGDGAASDLADLNLALKMDNKLTIADKEIADYDDAYESYQSAIDSWETGLLSRQGARKSSVKGSSFTSRSSAYKTNDPISAAYVSQFRPNSRSSATPTTMSPRARQKSSLRTAEIGAVYGMPNSRETSAQGSRRKRASDASRTQTYEDKSRPPSAVTKSNRSDLKVKDEETNMDSTNFDGSSKYSQRPPSSNQQKSAEVSSKPYNFKRPHQLRVVSADSNDMTTNINETSPVPSSDTSVSRDVKISERPQSRKLYLGNNGGKEASRSGGIRNDSNAKAPRSASAKACPSSQSLVDHGASATEISPKSSDNRRTITRTSSFGGFAQPAPWQGENLDERPPSRQRSAFPTHLGEALGRNRRGVNATVAPNNNRKVEAFSSESSCNNERCLSGADNSSLSRPPSRQRLNAQHLWSSNVEGNRQSPSPDSSDSDTEALEYVVSPIVNASQSTATMTLDLQNDHSVSKSDVFTVDKSRTPSPQLSLGPMYDPSADGFTQLENRGNSAPFKIRFNSSPSPSNIKKPKTASVLTKSFKDRSGFKREETEKDTDFVDMGNVELNRKGKGSSDTNSHSSSSPEQIDGIAWRSNPPSPSSQISKCNSGLYFHDDRNKTMGTSASAASLLSSNPRMLSVDAVNTRAFGVDDAQMELISPTSASTTRNRSRNQSATADDLSIADEELTVMTNCSDDLNMQMSQSIVLESSLGQDFLSLFAPSD